MGMIDAIATPFSKFKAFRRDGILKRAHPRRNCWLIAELEIPEKALSLGGLVTELSLGGLLYRESTRFILDRRGAGVVVRLPGFDLKGTIVNVSPAGYGVRLARPLSDDMLEALLARRPAPA